MKRLLIRDIEDAIDSESVSWLSTVTVEFVDRDGKTETFTANACWFNHEADELRITIER